MSQEKKIYEKEAEPKEEAPDVLCEWKIVMLDLHDIIAVPTRKFSDAEKAAALKRAKELING